MKQLAFDILFWLITRTTIALVWLVTLPFRILLFFTLKH